MTSTSPQDRYGTLAEKLDRFFAIFQPTIDLVERLMASKKNSQEVVLLLCARLDALASCLAREDQSNRQSFIRLLTDYSGHRQLMQSVSAGDLYYELGYHRWLTEGLIPKPGRLHRFSSVNDQVLRLLDGSGVPLTVEAVERLLTRLMRALTSDFRCRSGQPLRKPMLAKPALVTARLTRAFEKSKDKELSKNLHDALQPLLESKTLAGILYEKSRNTAVHEAWVEFEEAAFFSAERPFWEPLYSPYYPPFLLVRFPARFLLEMLFNCMMTMKHKMLATGKLPPDVHYHVFGPHDDDVEFLDEELLPRGAEGRHQFK